MANDNSYRRPRLRMPVRMLLRNALGYWPFLVWLGIALTVYWLYTGSVRYGAVMGIVDAIDQDISPTETARIASIDVTLGQPIARGQVVAQMDTSLMDATAAFEDVLEWQDAEETIMEHRQSILGMMRQMDGSLSAARTAYAAEKLRQSQSDAELAELKKDLERRQELLARRLMREEDVTALLPRIAALEKAEESYPALLAIHEAHIESTRSNLATMHKLLGMGEGGADSEDIEAIRVQREARDRVQELARSMRLAQRQTYLLRSALDGEVSRIYLLPGEVVPAGTPVVRVVNRNSTHVIAFLNEGQFVPFETGSRVFVWRLRGGARHAPAVVESVSPDIQTLPGRVSPVQGQAVRGRRVQIRIEGAHDFVPGETVQVQVDRPGWGDKLARPIRRLFWRGREERGEAQP